MRSSWFNDSDILVHSSGRLPLDRVTGGVGITDTNHSQIHAGRAYSLAAIIADLPAGIALSFSANVPIGTYVHLQNMKATLGVDFSLMFFEGDLVTPGNIMVPINRNRLSNQTSNLIVHDSPVTTNTTKLFEGFFSSAKFGGSGVIADGAEWVLSDGKTYTFVLTNENTQTANGSAQFDWYEEDEGYAL